ncbi:MAG: SpoIIE family protein phosphatase [Planctomycetota bacterium]
MRPLSVRQIIWLIAIGPTLVAGAVLLALSERAAETIAEALTTRYIEDAQSRVRQQIDEYLRSAILQSDLMAAQIERGALNPSDLESWLVPCVTRLKSAPDIASITFGDIDGRVFWVVRTPEGYECAFKLDPIDGMLREHRVTVNTEEVGELLRASEFDTLGRPWYRAGAEAENATWSEVYSWVGGGTGRYAIGSSYARAISGPDGQLAGVLSVDVTLGALSDFLARVPIAEQGTLLLADEGGMLLASSDAPVLDSDGNRRSIEAAMLEIDARLDRSQERPLLSARHHGLLLGEPARYATVSMSAAGFDGLTLLIGIPEDYLFAGVARTRVRLLATGGIVIVVVGALSFVLSSSLAQRMRAVNTHVRAVSQGRFESRLDERGPSEWQILAGDLNRMAGDLETYVETQKGLEVAMEVQQALLPESVPDPDGLEVAGHSKYCDETGGDYYDFLERSQSGATGQLVAVGDVMGHGIAAALLMATARAALRAHAPTSGTLGRLMTRVNDVLAADARHGRFMTLSILLFEPGDRSVRWASAGHDPALVVDPVSGEVSELEGGDMPLGVAEGVEYQEYSQAGLPEGALVLIGTDGVWEMSNESGEMYGKDRLLHVLAGTRGKSSQHVIDAIERDLVEFRGGASVKDDVTFVAVRFR